MMSLGVPAGAITPNQIWKSYSGKPASANVGTSGKLASRFLPVMAIGLSLPARMCGSEVTGVSKLSWT